MKTTIAIAVITLMLGGLAGSALTNKNVETVEARNAQRIAETPDSTDYLAIRPKIESLPSEDVSAVELEGLLYMREEEKLARDVYTTLYEKWGLQIFSNIAQSEQTHTEAVRDLLEKYNIEDPVKDDTVGAFENENLKGLYDSLTTQGLVSLEEALTVGATIEDLDIFDLDTYIAETNNEDIVFLYENLLRGSRNHMRAFISQLESRGETYSPQFISQTEYDEILAAPREKGSGGGSGEGSGKGGERGWGGGKR